MPNERKADATMPRPRLSVRLTLAADIFTALATQAASQPLPSTTTTQLAAVVNIASSRFNDLMWENDRAAFRIYSLDLEKAEPPSSSGVDA